MSGENTYSSDDASNAYNDGYDAWEEGAEPDLPAEETYTRDWLEGWDQAEEDAWA